MLQVLTLSDRDKWDKIVLNFQNYDIYYMAEYVEAFFHHGDGEPLLFYYKDDNIEAINVVMKREIIFENIDVSSELGGKMFDLSTPYGYGGFLIEGKINDESLAELDKKYVDYCKSHNIVSEFTRFHPVLDNVKYNNKLYDCVRLGKTVTIPLNSKKQVWETLTGKNRNVIRKAKKSGVEIHWGKDFKLMENFIPMYNATMDKDCALNYYYFDKKFYDSLLTDLKYNHLIFYALFEGKIISMAIIIFSNKQIHYHLSASNREYQHLSATNLLLSEVANWGVANDFDSFHLGGGLGSQEDNLFKFKSAFNKHSETTFSIGKKIFDTDRYNKLVDLRLNEKANEVDTNFFPIYRSS